MIKYSFLIPAFNRVKDTKVAIESVLKQKIKNFEIIVLDDKSTEDFEPLIKEYEGRVIFLRHEKNRGLSVSRNDLVKEAKGEYIIFLDNDDYIDEKFLEVIDPYLQDTIDLLSFTNDEIENGKVIKIFHKVSSNIDKGINMLKKFISNSNNFDAACFYVYNRQFYVSNNFKFDENKHHEDFGLVPIIISKAEKMISIDKPLYHVVLTPNSIIRSKDKEKIKRNVYDKLSHYDKLFKYFSKYEGEIKDLTFSFLSNVVLNDVSKLEGKDKKEFIKELKKRKVHKYLMSDNLKRKIKKLLVSINYNFYKMVTK